MAQPVRVIADPGQGLYRLQYDDAHLHSFGDFGSLTQAYESHLASNPPSFLLMAMLSIYGTCGFLVMGILRLLGLAYLSAFPTGLAMFPLAFIIGGPGFLKELKSDFPHPTQKEKGRRELPGTLGIRLISLAIAMTSLLTADMYVSCIFL
jgi:hypothetical protein